MNLRPRAVVLGVVAVVVVGGLAIAGWLFWSARTASDISVSWSPGSPDCAGTTVAKPGSGQPVIDAQEAMRCVITVEVANDSGRRVHVRRAVAPMVGPRTDTVVTAEAAQASPSRDIDAAYPLDQDLAGDESMTFDVVLVFHPSGCNAAGTFRSPNWPIVTVDVLGRAHDLPGDKDFAFHRDGEKTPGCRE